MTGDFDGDGYQDLVLTLPDASVFGAGLAWFPGGAAGLDLARSAEVPVPGVAYDALAGTCADVADFNGDGRDELLLGLPNLGAWQRGGAMILAGSPDGVAGIPSDARLLQGGSASYWWDTTLPGRLGGSLAIRRDVTGHRVQLGAPLTPRGAGSGSCGAVYELAAP